MRFFLLTIICITCCFLNGCGGGGGSASAPGTVYRAIPVTVSDGIIKNARVHLMSLKTGVVSRCETTATDTHSTKSCMTDNDGKASVLFQDSDINALDLDDVLYLWVDSTYETTIQTDSVTFTPVSSIVPPTVPGGEPELVQLKSILPKAEIFKNNLSNWSNISAEITRATTVSNLTHAKSLLVEKDSGLRLSGPRSASSSPSADGSDFYEKLEALEQDLQIFPPTDMNAKWFLLSTATMARLHEGIVPDNGTDSRSTDDMLYGLAANSATLGTTFAAKIDGINGFLTKVKAQLGEALHTGVVNLPAGKNWTDYTSLISEAAVKNATSVDVNLQLMTENPKLVLFLPYSGQHDVLSKAYQSGVTAALLSTDAFNITTIDSTGLDKDAMNLRFYGEDSKGNTLRNNIISDPDNIAVLSYLSGQSRAFASHHQKKMLVLSCGTATIFEQGYETIAAFAPSNRVQADSIAMLLSQKAQNANTNIPYIVFTEGVEDAADYSEDMYSSLLSRQFSSDIRVNKNGIMSINAGSVNTTAIATYAQLIGSFSLRNKTVNNETELVFPLNTLKSLLKDRTNVNAVYIGYMDNFLRLLKAFKDDTDLSAAVNHWYSVDGVMGSRTPSEIAAVYQSAANMPQISILTMGKTTTGAEFNNFATDFKSLPSIGASYDLTADADLIYYQLGYDMGKYLKSVVDTINSSSTLKLNRQNVLSVAQTQITSMPGVSGSGGTKTSPSDRGWYDRYDVNCSGSPLTCDWGYIGKISITELFN